MTKCNVNDKQLEEIILEYLNKQYRPYNLNDILLNLKSTVNGISKTTLTRALDSLVSNNQIYVKQFGKTNIYCCLEKPITNDSTSDVDWEQINQLREEYNIIEKDYNQHIEYYKNICKNDTNNDLYNQYIELINNIQKINGELIYLSNNNNNDFISIDEVEKFIIIKKKFILEINKREKIKKKIILLIKDLINPKNINDFLENEIGI